MQATPLILIAGASGFLGARAMARYPHALPVDRMLLRRPGDALQDFVRQIQPDIILNAAAISDIGTCGQNPEESYQANVVLPVKLAAAAEETGAKMISFSSDQVYTGCREPGPYSESIPLPSPANLYARHKLEAEQRVLDLHPSAVLLRATWMYDMPMYDHANRGNFLINTLTALAQGSPICLPGQQYRGITYVRQAVQLLDQVFDLPGGVYNYGSENSLTMAQTAQALLQALGAAGCVQDTGAVRHNLWMDCSKIQRCGICFDSTADGFRRCLSDYGLG